MIVDVVLIAVVLLAAVIGSKRGALHSVIRLLSFAGAGYAVLIYSYSVSQWVYENIVRPIVIDKVKEAIFSGRSDEADYIYYEYIKIASEDYSKASDIAEYVTDTYLSGIFNSAARIATGILMFIIIFIVISWILKLITGALKRNSALNGLDSVFGAVFGLASGLVAVAVAAFLLKIYSGLNLDITPVFSEQLSDSYVVQLAGDILYKYV